MRLSQKKNCEGCRAFRDYAKSYEDSCELGFDNRGPLIANMGINRSIPQEPCYKPRTISQLFEARELVRQDREQVEGKKMTKEESKVTVRSQGGRFFLQYRRFDGEWVTRFLRSELDRVEAEKAADTLRSIPMKELTKERVNSELAAWLGNK